MNKLIQFNDSLGNLLFPKTLDDIIYINKELNLNTINTWFDTGIGGMNLASGTYIMQITINSSPFNQQYHEHLSGILAWYSGTTNSLNADIIPLSKAGLARNGHEIKLRYCRTTEDKFGKLQISDSIAWTGLGIVTFAFKKII